MTGFFDGIRQVPARVGGQQLDVPVFYGDLGGSMAIFPARMGAVRRLLPDTSLQPARLAPGVAAVAVAGYRYRETPVGPYDEVGILVPLADGFNPPMRTLLDAQRSRRSSWFIHWLAVNREYATHGGEAWGLDSPLTEIGVDEAADGATIWSIADERGQILRLECEALRTRAGGGPLTSLMRTRHDGRTQSFEVRVNALEEGSSSRFGSSRLEIAESHPLGAELASLLLSRKAIATSAVPRSQGILFAPDRLTPAVLRALGFLCDSETGSKELLGDARRGTAAGGTRDAEDRGHELGVLQL